MLRLIILLFFLLTRGILTASIDLVNNKKLNKEKKVMETISVTISTKETEILLKTADYLRSLAGVGAVQTIEEEVLLSPEKEADAMGERIDDVVAAASAPAAVAPVVGATTVDSDGTPWDARIHSGGKTFMTSGPKAGTWKLIRGVDKNLVEQVKAELLQGEESVIEVAPVVVPPVETPVAVAPVVAPAAVAPPPFVPPVAAPVVATATTYAELIPRITAQSTVAGAAKLDKDDVNNALANTGAAAAGAINLTELAKPEHAVYIPLVAAELERVWATRA